MSNIPKSKRKPTSTEFFDKFLKLRVKVTQFITDDFSDIKVRYFQNAEGLILERHDFWKLDETRRSILRILTDMLDHITHANSIFPVCIKAILQDNELKIKKLNKIISREDLRAQYRSWRGGILREISTKQPTHYHNHKSLQTSDRFFHTLMENKND